MAEGVCCGGEKLKDVINHLYGAPHEAAMEQTSIILVGEL